ncbi:hypothetical protein SBRCBS47491_001030 [Sporothrix bragantina]|uniref:Queuine tRNA-ribosyltransferase accessory subunit 2 n=1 Tax=Sporothrix bragantina TaxID=671064 RepID=A0ABP0AVB0_9PEZI
MASDTAGPYDPASASMPPPPLFRILKTAASSVGNGIGDAVAAEDTLGRTAVPRMGLLALSGRKPLATPAFFAVTSRGAVPHVTPDNIVRTDLVNGAYFALEDFVENIPLRPGRVPPIYSTPASPVPTLASASSSPSSSSSSPLPSIPRLHTFSGLPSSTISVLAPRRHPAAASHLGNGPAHISIITSTGFQKLTLDAYHAALDILRPDIAVPMADLTYSGGVVSHTANNSSSTSPSAAYASVPHPNAKRAFRMAERSEDWIDQVYRDSVADKTGAALFAPTLPVPYATQWQYLNRLAELAAPNPDEAEISESSTEEQAKPTVAGLAVYDVDIMQDLHADYADTLCHLPRLSLHPAVTPHHVLRQVSLGIDVMLLPAITDASEQGLAYAFSWEEASSSSSSSLREAGSEQLPLAIDLTDPMYKADLRPLRPSCTCAACATHHRAYLHHLLDAREMLAWTLLQMHNHHVMTELFAGIRKTLETGGVAAFQEQARRFRIMYEPELPMGQGKRPRLRGYQVKTNGVVEAPLNKPQWGRLEDVKPAAAASVVMTVVGDDQMAVDA